MTVLLQQDTALTATVAESMSVFLGRQAIFDRKSNVVAYELLYRSGQVNEATVTDADEATRTVLANALVEFGLDRIAGDKDVLINFSPEALTADFAEILPRERTIIEVLEDVRPDDPTVVAFEKLKADGCRLALDDVVYDPALAPLYDLADLVKVDLPLTDPALLAGHVEALKKHDVTLLAEKVETEEEMKTCRDLGFDLFQGYFFCRPTVIEGRRMQADRSRTLQLLARLQDPDLGAGEAADLISGDPALSVKLLRYINSSAVGLTREVNSIKHAANLVGRAKLRVWATLIGLGGMSTKPRELMVTANVRGRMCELIGESVFGDSSGAFFTVGLFSLLDAFTDSQLDEVVRSLPLSEDVKNGLLARESDGGGGPLGKTLSAVLAWETQADAADFNSEVLNTAYRDAVEWATVTMDGLSTS